MGHFLVAFVCFIQPLGAVMQELLRAFGYSEGQVRMKHGVNMEIKEAVAHCKTVEEAICYLPSVV